LSDRDFEAGSSNCLLEEKYVRRLKLLVTVVDIAEAEGCIFYMAASDFIRCHQSYVIYKMLHLSNNN